MNANQMNPLKNKLHSKEQVKERYVVNDFDLQMEARGCQEDLSNQPNGDAKAFGSLTCNLETAGLPVDPNQGEEVIEAMAEAENAYDSMMQIRRQLNQAYEELMHSKS